MIDYTTKRDIFVEDIIRENLDIGVTPKMKELLTIQSVLNDLMEKLNDQQLINKLSDFHMNNIWSELIDEVRYNSSLNTI